MTTERERVIASGRALRKRLRENRRTPSIQIFLRAGSSKPTAVLLMTSGRTRDIREVGDARANPEENTE